jgi:hypothetical protein
VHVAEALGGAAEGSYEQEAVAVEGVGEMERLPFSTKYSLATASFLHFV